MADRIDRVGAGLLGHTTLLTGLLVMSSTTALAQANTVASAAPGSDADGGIVVTATRREERSIDVPVSVSALGGQKLDVLNSSGLDIRFLAAKVPSLQIESSYGRTFPRFYVRGLGNTDFDPNSAQPVSVVLDDVAVDNAMLKSFPIFDVAGVEVLRGPQGTLFGRNTPAGVVKIDSAKPTDTYSGHASASWGTYNTVNSEVAFGGPLGGGFAWRAAGILQRRDNWVTNISTSPLNVAPRKLEGYRDMAGRFLLSYEDGPFEALLNVHARDLDGTPRIFRAGIFRQGSNRFVDGFDVEEVSIDGYSSQTMTQWGTNLHLDYSFPGIGTVSSITAYEMADVDSMTDVDGGDTYVYFAQPALGLHVGNYASNTGGNTKPKEFSQELRFASERLGDFRFQTGVYYFHQNLKYSETAVGLGGGDLTQEILHANINKNWGIFASADYMPTDNLTLTGGLRYSHDDKRDRIDGYTPDLTDGLTLPMHASVKGGAVTWDLSATYKINPDVSVYARAATGYLGPAIQDRVTFGSIQTTADKQHTISGEAGIKGALPAGLNFALDGYWWRTKDLQLTAVGGAVNTARLINADHAIGYGIEAELSAQPIRGLGLTASGSWNHTAIKDENLFIAPCGSGVCTVLDPLNAEGLAIVHNNPLPQAPEWIANLTASYSLPVGDGEAFVYTDWSYRSSINYFLYEAAEFKGRAQIEGGLRAGYRWTDGYQLAVFARNITNQIRAISAVDFNNLTGMVSEPRIIGAEFSVDF